MTANPDYRRPWIIAALVFLAVLIVDINLLAPGISWAHDSQDSGDLICAAYFLGIPHPTGYPTYCMLAKLFQLIIPFGSIAWRTNFLSAFAGATCCMIIFLLVHRVLNSGRSDSGKKGFASYFAIPVIAGLGLGFSRTFLAQSVVSEVYTLNALFVTLNLYLIVEAFYMARGGDVLKPRKMLMLLALTYGLALTNHLSTAFLFPIIAYTFLILRRSINLKTAAFCLLAFVIGLLPYLYLPIRSAANPPFDWGNPETMAGFYWVISGMQFKHLMFASFDYQVLHRLVDRFEPVLELGAAFALLSVWGATVILKGGLKGKLSAIALALMILNLYPVMHYHIADTKSFLLPTYIGLTVLFAMGLDDLVKRASVIRFKHLGLIIPILAILISIPWYANNIRIADLSHHNRPMEYASGVYESLPDNAILIENYYGRAFTMWYYHYIEPNRKQKNVAMIYSEHLQFDWGIEILRRQYPWVEFPQADLNGERALAALIELNIGKTPIFIAREYYNLKDNYQLIPHGEVTMVVPLDGQ